MVMFYGSGVLGDLGSAALCSCWGGQPLVGTNACCLRSCDNPALGCWSSNWGYPLPSAEVDASGCVVSDLHLSRVALHPSLALTGSLIYTHLHSKIVYLSVYPPSIVSFWCCVLFECALLQKQQLATQRVCLLHPRLLLPFPFFSSFFSNFSSLLSSIWPLRPLCSSNNIH